jgi:hypothetical protein
MSDDEEEPFGLTTRDMRRMAIELAMNLVLPVYF